MSKFLQDFNEFHRKLEEQAEGTPLTYSMARNMGMLRGYTFRLPVHTLAQLDVLSQQGGPWASKNEMVFQMLDDLLGQFYDEASPHVRQEIDEATKKALEEWNEELKEKGHTVTLGQLVEEGTE